MFISEFKVGHGVGVRSQTELTLPDSVDKSLSWQVFYATKLLRPANGSSRQRSVRGDSDMYAFWGREVSLWCSSEPTKVPSAQMLLYKFWGVSVPDSQK